MAATIFHNMKGYGLACKPEKQENTINSFIMYKLKIIYLFLVLLLVSTANGQKKSDRFRFNKLRAEKELNSALSDTKHNFFGNAKVLIKDTKTAVNIAEPILFSIFGKDEIISERPYDIFFINKYWIISGTLPADSKGGTFLIIMDSRDCKIIRLTHGK